MPRATGRGIVSALVTGGLETGAFAALVPRIVIIALNTNDGQTTRRWELPLLVVLAGMLRPEGVQMSTPGARASSGAGSP